MSYPDAPLSRRFLLGGLAAAAAITPAEPETPQDRHRANRAYRIRVDAARLDRDAPSATPLTNGDEDRYSNKIGNYSKGLPHDDAGEVDLNAYNTLTHALTTQKPADFEAVIMGSADPALQRKFVNPQAGLAFNLESAD